MTEKTKIKYSKIKKYNIVKKYKPELIKTNYICFINTI